METQTESPFFILYKPKDIVSGDFYYAITKQHSGSDSEKFYLCTADCTGHGVPGALMSMLGISNLNESILEKDISDPGKILDNVRQGLIHSLNPEGTDVQSNDGMDCVLCSFDFKNKKLAYAAANNTFYIVRNNELIESKTDKMPVGKSPREDVPFTTHVFDLQDGDIVYTLTDGYPDQFGGDKGKKFKYKQLEELIMSIHKKSMAEQKQILNSTIENWRGKLEQVDDILIIAVKI
ncbi:hypothetical protein BH09BAC5_BH09BAC5_27420 [soil metagenome]